MITVGTCGNCGGPVMTPESWCSILPPPKTCANCGSSAAAHGPVVEMERPRVNVATIGHVDHGKKSLIEALVRSAACARAEVD